MTKGTELTASLVEALEGIVPSAGFHTQLFGIYEDARKVPKDARKPYALVRLNLDRIDTMAGPSAKRVREYEIEVVFAGTAERRDLELCHHDLLRSFGLGKPQPQRAFPGWRNEEEAAYLPPGVDGSTTWRLVSAVSLNYSENY